MSATKILRNGSEVGMVDLTTAQLHSADTKLTQLWNGWLKDGFKVLGPSQEEPPPGVSVDAIYIIHPSPTNLGW